MCDTTYDDDFVLETIEETHRIAFDRIENFLPDNTVRLPSFVVPAGYTATEALIKFSIDGLNKLGLADDKDYLARLKHELNIIDDRGFSKYFLTMKAIVDVTDTMMLAGAGRGSGAGSLVAYCLGITQIDPIKYGLLFSRFLRSDAEDYPDIDYDVSRPMELKDKLIELWGEDCVAPISNWNTLQLKSLIKDISKLYGIEFGEVNLVTNAMISEATPLAKQKHGIKAGMYNPTWQEVMEFSSSLKNFLNTYPDVKTHVQSLVGQVRSCSRHAGGVVIAEDLDKSMPLINSKGVRQTPWSEGQNVRHLEPMGFIKFDLLGLSTLAMMETAIELILKRHFRNENPTFAHVKSFYDRYLHPDKIDLDDAKVYENVFHKGNFVGTFQFTEDGARNFAERVKPNNIIDVSAITSIYRPGPLSANVHEDYIDAKESPQYIKYLTPEVQEITEETFGFLIFQEQIAKIAHALGKDLSLDEGNLLRKLLTKKGTGKGFEVKDAIHKKFIDGCLEKGISQAEAQSLWEKFEYFSGYGFNKSHAVCYSVISYQCAWLLTYYEAEWVAAFLDKEPESRKERAINTAKSLGYSIAPVDVNTSGRTWEITKDGKTLIQPLTSIKGFGESAMLQVLDNRPFVDIEDLLFREEVKYAKLNKKALGVLCLAGGMDSLMDDRFTGRKHFWSASVVERPKTKKKFHENIELFRGEGDFSEEEIIQFKTDLTGIFPMSLVITPETIAKLKEKYIPPISEFDEELQICWFIPRKVIPKKTKRGKDYWILEVIDSNNETEKIRCWGIDPKKDRIHINRPYMSRLQYNPKWGFSTRSMYRNFRLLG
jgi:DNA polymerase-3 subunit alpha